jgi:hypothetical protein
MAITLTGNEVAPVTAADGAGHPAAVQPTPTLVQLTNFEGSSYLPTSQSATSNTTLAAINFTNVLGGATNVPFNLVASGVYVFEIYLSVTNNASGGLKLQFGGTVTPTTLAADTWAYNTATLAAQGNITSLSSNLVAYTGAVTNVFINGTIAVNVAGTFTLQFAQNVSYGTATTINAGSNFWIDRIV